MSTYDTILRGGTVVTHKVSQLAEIAISGGKIAAIEPQISGSAREEINCAGLHIFPGLIDAHVHFNEPGRAEWEGWATGSRALAAGGATTCIEMPLNAHPPTIDAAAFDVKVVAAEASSVVDFALWGGLVPGNIKRMEELVEHGVVGFKAFMSNSGIEDFPAVDDLTLIEGMAQAAKLDSLVALHAENDAITSGLAARAEGEGRTGIHDFHASRPVIAEVEAIERACRFSNATRCPIHIVHVSSGYGLSVIFSAQQGGVDVTCETCPHYLYFTENDVEQIGALAKCAPPIRAASDRDALWKHLADGSVDFVASDHSPAPPGMKTDPNFFKVWGGISGCQTMLQVMLTCGYHQRGLPLERIAATTSFYPARRYRLLGKGQLAVGFDADLAIVDIAATSTLRAEDLHYRHQHSPYVGYDLRGRIARTLVRGATVALEGQIVAGPIGRLVKAAPELGGYKRGFE